MNETTVLELTGNQILEVLENGVSQYPKLEGRFPQVSGIRFAFDPSEEAHHRVLRRSVTIAGVDLVGTKKYRLATVAYMASGKDGYDVLSTCPILASGEECPFIQTLIVNHFRVLEIENSLSIGRHPVLAHAAAHFKASMWNKHHLVRTSPPVIHPPLSLRHRSCVAIGFSYSLPCVACFA